MLRKDRRGADNQHSIKHRNPTPNPKQRLKIRKKKISHKHWQSHPKSRNHGGNRSNMTERSYFHNYNQTQPSGGILDFIGTHIDRLLNVTLIQAFVSTCMTMAGILSKVKVALSWIWPISIIKSCCNVSFELATFFFSYGVVRGVIRKSYTTTTNNNNNRQVGSTIKNIASKGGLILLSALIIIPVVSASGDRESLIGEFGNVTAAVAGGFAAGGSEALFGETKVEECDEFNQMPPELEHHMYLETRNRNRVFGSTKPRQQIGMNDGMNSPDQSPDKKRITLGTPGKLFKSATRNLFGSRGSSRNSANSGGSRGSNADHSDDDKCIGAKQ